MEELNWCIDYLISYNHLTNLKYTYNFNTFRALMNITFPNNLSDEYYNKQDHVLKELLSSKNVIDANSLKYINNIAIYKGDITLIKCDAIVNACNEKLLGCFQPLHNCIDNAIHTFAGIELRMECARMIEYMDMPEKTGVARKTYAYNLPASHVIHTVGPIIYDTVTDLEKEQLASCYRACLEIANAYSLKSIAFCCISTGEFRFPNELAAQIAIDTVRTYLKETNSKIQVVFNVFKDIDYDIYNKLLG